jgi:hypothetical protein
MDSLLEVNEASLISASLATCPLIIFYLPFYVHCLRSIASVINPNITHFKWLFAFLPKLGRLKCAFNQLKRTFGSVIVMIKIFSQLT